MFTGLMYKGTAAVIIVCAVASAAVMAAGIIALTGDADEHEFVGKYAVYSASGAINGTLRIEITDADEAADRIMYLLSWKISVGWITYSSSEVIETQFTDDPLSGGYLGDLGDPVRTETLSTVKGQKDVDVYLMEDVELMDQTADVTVYIGKSDGIVYRITANAGGGEISFNLLETNV